MRRLPSAWDGVGVGADAGGETEGVGAGVGAAGTVGSVAAVVTGGTTTPAAASYTLRAALPKYAP